MEVSWAIMSNDDTQHGTPEIPAISRKKWIWDNVVSLGLALLVVFMIRSSIVEAFKIPSGSMIPTLLTGDHIFVNKFAYGFKIPFSDWIVHDPVYLLKRDDPKRGDIIVFMYPQDESVYFIKRVIGTPGDTIELRSKLLYINGKPMNRDLLPVPSSDKIFKELNDPKYTSTSLDVFTEHLETVDHPIMLEKSLIGSENFGPVTVPPSKLFVMGDNRDFSNDSRFWGFVPMGNVKGKAMIIWLSLWIDFRNSQFIFRPERIGTILR